MCTYELCMTMNDLEIFFETDLIISNLPELEFIADNEIGSVLLIVFPWMLFIIYVFLKYEYMTMAEIYKFVFSPSDS